MRRICIALALSALLGLAHMALASPPDTRQVAQFPTVRAAQRHCPLDTVLWLDTFTRHYYYSNSKRYGKTAQGAFVCKKEFKGIGKRATKDGSQ